MVRYQEDFSEHVTHLRKDIFEFIARGALRVELTTHALESRLNSMGFKIRWRDPPFSLNQLLLLFGVVCIIMMSGFVLFGGAFTEGKFEQTLVRAIMISVIYSVAVACAVLPKTKWDFARNQAGQVRPVGFYLVAGLMSAGISYVTSMFFNVVLLHRLDWVWQRSLLTYPWLLVSFATALITAIMVDNPHFDRMSQKWQRCLEGLVQGAVMLAVTSVTYVWLSERLNDFKGIDLRYLKYPGPRLIPIIVMGAVIGFVIGFFIPTWYRRHQKQSTEETGCGLTLAGAVPIQPNRIDVSA
jgi:hypothetical protein